MVVKRSGVTEPFSRTKVINGVRKACQGRPVTEDALAQLGQRVEEAVRATGSAELTTHDVGLAILGPLQELDLVAYLRFASVYRAFDSLEDFEAAITELKDDITELKDERKQRFAENTGSADDAAPGDTATGDTATDDAATGDGATDRAATDGADSGAADAGAAEVGAEDPGAEDPGAAKVGAADAGAAEPGGANVADASPARGPRTAAEPGPAGTAEVPEPAAD
jgi:transcriptional repressor NrdR